MPNAPEMTPEQMMDRGLSLLRQSYYSDIRSIAQDIRAEIASGEIGDREALLQYIRETVDGNAWVIYTRNAQTVLLVSDNDGAYAEEYGEEGMVTDGAIEWSRLAYAAMEHDLMEQLDAEGVNVNGDTRAEMLGEDEDEDEDDGEAYLG